MATTHRELLVENIVETDRVRAEISAQDAVVLRALETAPYAYAELRAASRSQQLGKLLAETTAIDEPHILRAIVIRFCEERRLVAATPWGWTTVSEVEAVFTRLINAYRSEQRALAQLELASAVQDDAVLAAEDYDAYKEATAVVLDKATIYDSLRIGLGQLEGAHDDDELITAAGGMAACPYAANVLTQQIFDTRTGIRVSPWRARAAYDADQCRALWLQELRSQPLPASDACTRCGAPLGHKLGGICQECYAAGVAGYFISAWLVAPSPAPVVSESYPDQPQYDRDHLVVNHLTVTGQMLADLLLMPGHHYQDRFIALFEAMDRPQRRHAMRLLARAVRYA